VIEREIAPHLVRLFGQYPFVTVTGPRQSGKTTLCRSVFADLDYANLEAPHVREFAAADPRGFLAQFRDGAVLDEVHRVPDLLSYLQVLADEERRNGLFVLTGSEQFGLTGAVSQSLAGRTAMLRLLPFSLGSVKRRVLASMLASYLIGINSAKQIVTHPLRGLLFENLVLVEALKHRLNAAVRLPNLTFFRDRSGLEVDLLYPTSQGLTAIEIKAGRTIASDWFTPARRLAESVPEITEQVVVYGGDEPQKRSDATVVPIADFSALLTNLDSTESTPSTETNS